MWDFWRQERDLHSTAGLSGDLYTTKLHLELSGCFPLETHHKFPHEAESKNLLTEQWDKAEADNQQTIYIMYPNQQGLCIITKPHVIKK